MLAIYAVDKPVVFKAPKTSSKAESVSQVTKPGAKSRHKKLFSSKQPSVSSREATKGGSSKAPTSFKTSDSKKRKEYGSAKDSNPSQPSVSAPVDNGMHKEDQQATGWPNLYRASFIIHFEFALGYDASVESTAESDPGLSAPSEFVPQQQDQSKSVSKGLEIVLTQPRTRKGASFISRQIEEEEASNIIKLEDLAKLVSDVPSFKDLDSPEDDPVIVVDDSDEDEDDESQKHKLELEKNKAELESALLKAQPSFPNVEQLKELLVKSLKTKFSNIRSAHDFGSSLPTELKDLPSKINELTIEVKGLKKQVHELEIELPGDLKEIPTKLDDFTKNVTSLTSKVAELKTFQRAEKNAEKENLNNQQPKPTTLPATTIIPSVITTITTPMQSPPQYPQKGSSQPEGEHIKKDKGKKAMSSKDAKEVSTEIESDDETTQVPGSMVESYKKKELKKFNFVTESGEHVYLTKEQISAQKKINEEVKVKATRREGEIRKEELIDLLGLEVMNKKGPITLKVYREDDISKIIVEFKASDLHLGEWREVVTAYLNKKGKGWTSIYKQIQERMEYLRITKAKLGIDLDIPLSDQDPLDRLNDLANKKRKHVDDIHDFFRAKKRLKSLVQYEDQPVGTVLNEPVL
ncbi:hypothetical protein Tco_0664686, partial [Tanacetum coccineum]